MIGLIASIALGSLVGISSHILLEKLGRMKEETKIAGSAFAGFLGAWTGHGLFNTMGPLLVGSYAILPSFIVSVLLVILWSFIAEKL